MLFSDEAVKQRYVDDTPSSQAFSDIGMRDYIASDITLKMLKNYINL